MAKLSDHRGPLTLPDIAAGMAAALRNARRLAHDAETLLAAGSWPSAASLAILSIEESGKVGVLRGMAAETDPQALKAAWRQYRSHPAKLSKPIGLNPSDKSLAIPGMAEQLTKERDELVADIDAMKQSGFYTDCKAGTGTKPVWVEPLRCITENQAREAVSVAKLTCDDMPDTTVRELELFAQHYKPTEGTPDMVTGWLNWVRAMEGEGLLNGTREEVTDRVLDSFFGIEWRTGKLDVQGM